MSAPSSGGPVTARRAAPVIRGCCRHCRAAIEQLRPSMWIDDTGGARCAEDALVDVASSRSGLQGYEVVLHEPLGGAR